MSIETPDRVSLTPDPFTGELVLSDDPTEYEYVKIGPYRALRDENERLEKIINSQAAIAETQTQRIRDLERENEELRSEKQ